MFFDREKDYSNGLASCEKRTCILATIITLSQQYNFFLHCWKRTSDPIQYVLICNSQPQNNKVAEQKQQKRQGNWTTCWTPVSAYTQNTWKEPSIAPFWFISSASFIGLLFFSFKCSNIPRAKECEIPWRFSNGILGWVITRNFPYPTPKVIH